MSKKSAAIALMVLVVTLVAVNTVVLPDLGYFLKIGTMDSMFSVGKALGSALKAISPIFEFVGIVLMLA